MRRWKYELRLLALLPCGPSEGFERFFIYHLSAEQLGDMLPREESDYEHTGSSKEPSTRGKSAEYPLADTALFAGFAFLITWRTGMAVIFSIHANLVNGADQVEHPIPLPLPVATSLVIIGAFGPFLAAVAVDRVTFRPGWCARAIRSVRALARPPGVVCYGAPRPRFPRSGGTLCRCFGWRSNAKTVVSLPRLVHFAGWSVGPWGEELGWRGYLQPVLQKRLGALGASLVVGTMWSLWHYWPVATPAGGSLMELLQAPFLTWLTYEVANSMMMAWLYNSTGGSLPVAWAAHVGLSLGQNVVDKHPIPFGSFVLTFCTVW